MKTPLHPDRTMQSQVHDALAISEWDFRQVTEAELLTATLVEYTRSSHSAMAAIKEWQTKSLESTALDKTVRSFSEALTRSVDQPLTITDTIDLLFSDRAEIGDLEVRNGLLRNLRSIAASDLGPQIDCEVAVRFTALDLSWNEMRSQYGADNLRTRFVPSAPPRRCVKGGLGPRSTYEHYLKDQQIKVEKLLIDWSAPISDIECSFALWSRERKEEIAPVSRKAQNSRVRWDQLKFLAAYRLHQNDKDFHRFRRTVEDRMDAARGSQSWPDVMPLYKTHKGWLGAVKNAHGLLANCYPRGIRLLFGFPIFEFDD